MTTETDILAANAKMARERAKFATPKDAAAAIGCSRTLVIAWEDGSTTIKGSKYLLPAARAYRVRPEWLASNMGPDGFPWSESANSEEPEWKDVRGTTQGLGLGKAVEADEYAESHKLKFRADSLRRKRLKPEHLEVAYGKGDSMLPRVHDGDAIMFDKSDITPKDGALYVIQLDGSANHEPQVKRCMVLDDAVYFVADNPNGDHGWNRPRRMDSKKQPIEILGRVRWIGSWED